MTISLWDGYLAWQYLGPEVNVKTSTWNFTITKRFVFYRIRQIHSLIALWVVKNDRCCFEILHRFSVSGCCIFCSLFLCDVLILLWGRFWHWLIWDLTCDSLRTNDKFDQLNGFQYLRTRYFEQWDSLADTNHSPRTRGNEKINPA